MDLNKFKIWMTLFPLILFPYPIRAEIKTEKTHIADNKKNNIYISDGRITGGHAEINSVIIKDIRRSLNPEYERIVVDLLGQQNGETTELSHMPYYEVALHPEENRIVLTIWGKPKLNLDSSKVIQSFKRSKIIKNVVLLPRVEDETWTFAFDLVPHTSEEVFDLKNPVRLILDIKKKKT